VVAEPSLAGENVLRPVLARPPIREYLAGLWSRRHFIVAVPRNQLRATNMNTLLGNLWFLVNPALQMLVYFLIFGVLLSVDRGVENYLGYLVVGVLPFAFVSSSILAAARCLHTNLTLIRSIYFPRAVIPIATTLAGFFTFLPSVAVMVGMVLLTGSLPTWRWLLLPIVLLMVVAFTQGLVFVVARIGKAFPDLHALLPHLTRLLFYCSGVLFAPASFTNNDWVLWLFKVNPFFEMLELFRWVLLGRSAPWEIWLLASVWSTLSFIGGGIVFWRGETSYGAA
jgi:teichoic acid transport system permease protein